MPDTDSEIVCNVHENGVCGLHNVEVERRRNVQEDLKAYEPIKKLVYGLAVTSTLLLFIISGSYVYTTTLKEETLTRDRELVAHNIEMDAKIERLIIQITRLATIIEIKTAKQTDPYP